MLFSKQFIRYIYSELAEAENTADENVNPNGRRANDSAIKLPTTTKTKSTAKTTASGSNSLSKRVQLQQESNAQTVDETANNSQTFHGYAQHYQLFYSQSNLPFNQTYPQSAPFDYNHNNYHNYYM